MQHNQNFIMKQIKYLDTALQNEIEQTARSRSGGVA